MANIDFIHLVVPGFLDSFWPRLIKRFFDILLSFTLLVFFLPLIFVLWFFSSIDTGLNGFFSQIRIGQYGNQFLIFKIRTMRPSDKVSSITILGDSRVTKLGSILRRLKLDELPQLYNIFKGDMSFVGPRPDVPGFADCLRGRDRLILKVKPGITGLATLKYRSEEGLLADQIDPESYNKSVVWPDKVRLNLKYITNWSFLLDLKIILRTIL